MVRLTTLIGEMLFEVRTCLASNVFAFLALALAPEPEVRRNGNRYEMVKWDGNKDKDIRRYTRSISALKTGETLASSQTQSPASKALPFPRTNANPVSPSPIHHRPCLHCIA